MSEKDICGFCRCHGSYMFDKTSKVFIFNNFTG